MSEDLLNQFNFTNDWTYDIAKRVNNTLWNQRLWVMNDSSFYNMAKLAIHVSPSVEAAAKSMLEDLRKVDEATPDGVPWTYEGVLSSLKGVEYLKGKGYESNY